MKTSILTASALLLLALAANANTLDVPGTYPSIQSAINAASPGDTVLVAPGTYVENLDFKGKGITVKSSSGATVTTIDGQNPSDPNFASVVIFDSGEGPGSVLDGFTLTNGGGTWLAWTFFGGGIFIGSTSSPTIANNIIHGNTAAYGGGICLRWYSDPLIVNNIIHNNAATTVGGGICISSNSDPVITSNTVTENSAIMGGGLSSTVGCYPVLTNTIIWHNQASQEVYTGGEGVVSASFCDIQGGWPGSNNIDADPLFVNPSASDFHLGAGSPCVDAGDNLAPGLQTRDFEGDVRVCGACVDIGADEFDNSGGPGQFQNAIPRPRPQMPLEGDSFIDHHAPDTNKGAANVMRVRNNDGSGTSDDYTYDLMVEFQLNRIPPGSQIQSAVLKLYYTNWIDNDPAGRPLSLHRITGDWAEDSVTWNSRPSWEGTPTDAAIVPTTPGVWMQWDVTADVQDMVDGVVPNHGWTLADHTPWGSSNIPITNFRPREYGTHKPKLLVSF